MCGFVTLLSNHVFNSCFNISIYFCMFFVSNYHKRTCFSFISEREEGGKRQGERKREKKNQLVVTYAHNLSMCPHYESNLKLYSAEGNAPTH